MNRSRALWTKHFLGATAVAAALLATGTIAQASMPGATPLSVRSTPAGAAVMVDGTLLGRTPFEGLVGAGGHEVEIAASGHVAFRTVILGSGDSVVLDVILRRTEPAEAAAKAAAAAADELPLAELEPESAGSIDDLAAEPSGTSISGRVSRRAGPNEWVALGLTLAVPAVSIAAGLALTASGSGRYAGVGMSLASAGLILGPSVGSIYGGNWSTGLMHAGIRASGLATLGGGFYLTLLGAFGGLAPVAAAGLAVVATGGVIIVGSWVVEAALQVKLTRKFKAKRSVRLSASPMVATPWGMAPGATVALAGW